MAVHRSGLAWISLSQFSRANRIAGRESFQHRIRNCARTWFSHTGERKRCSSECPRILEPISSIEVTSADDESPQYRIAGGNDPFGDGRRGRKQFLHTTYTFDAPVDLTSRAFRLDLSCFWSLRGCRSAGQLAPLTWQDKQAIDAATIARLQGAGPCPDKILAGRVRYLLDLDLLLLEITNSRTERINEEGQDLDEYYSDYRVAENLRGNSQRTWNSVRSRDWIPSPTDLTQRIFNLARNTPPGPGNRELMFTNLDFYSCALIPATPSALSIVRGAAQAPRRAEDESVSGLQ